MENKYGADVFQSLVPAAGSMDYPGYFGEEYSDADIIMVLASIQWRQNEIENARGTVLEKAERYLRTAQQEGDRYRIRNLSRMIRIYGSEISAIGYKVVGWDYLIERIEALIPMLFFCLYIGGQVYSLEKDIHADLLLSTSFFGGSATSAAKLVSVVMLSLLSVVLCNLATFTVIWLGYGMSGGMNPVQVLDGWTLSPLNMRVWELCLLKIGAEMVFCAVSVVFYAAISRVSRKTWQAYIAGSLITVCMLAGYYLFADQIQHADLLSCIDLSRFLATYDTVNILNRPVFRVFIHWIIWIAAAFLTAVSCVWDSKSKGRNHQGKRL